ncbi:MAG: tsaE [Panacagrimonas sp.]|jgi:tRNA threonylcarbamoyladenosine biosynthesis protein TsaE|nr:tRNA (adenosine(37)-N6)-threonylcarbamoyltransferase complex ATPase subunit type 1 TsaE [Panacagrimonas sp.]MCC2655550.1 tsaE [Panacagrimonas sp.]
MSPTRVELADEAATLALGARIGRSLCTAGGGVVYLRGDLGAGKTTLARGLLRAAGVEGTLRSPTYTLMEPYAAGGQSFLHLDLYRLADPAEVEQLGLRDYPVETTVWLVEWPEKGAGFLPPANLEVRLAIDGAGRVAELDAAPTNAGNRPIIDLN